MRKPLDLVQTAGERMAGGENVEAAARAAGLVGR
jgi:hypothetical protein